MASLFSFISNPFEHYLGLLALFVGSAGIAIILFTVIIRLVLSPLQIIQLRSARAMQRLQPKIAELRKKHGKDKQTLTQETMKLYKEHKVNPAMGCLPMLLQFPVLIGLFWALRGLGGTPTQLITKANYLLLKEPAKLIGKTINVTPAQWDKVNTATTWYKKHYTGSAFSTHDTTHVYNLFHAHFLWLSNGLGQHDPLYILPLLAGATQWLQSRMMMQRSSDPQQQSMNMLMNFTPLIIIFFAANYPSGLSLYWVTSTVLGILISVRITGWGTIPRVDRMIFGNAAPARGLVSQTKPRPSSKALSKPDVSGKATDADIVLSNGDTDGDQEIVPKSETVNQNGSALPRQGRRRSSRQRGGRRG